MTSELVRDVRNRHVWLMGKTLEILRHILRDVGQEQAQTLRDGSEGWTVLEVLCHLRDFDRIFHDRALLMIEQDTPELVPQDHEALATEHRYNEQLLDVVFAELVASRHNFIEFFKTLDDEQWSREGKHPERDRFTMTDAVMQVGLHDCDHIEQITRILEQAKS